MELFATTINSFELLTLVKKSSILNKPVFKKTWIRYTGFANIRLVMKKFIATIFTKNNFLLYLHYITFNKIGHLSDIYTFLHLYNLKNH